MDNTLFGLTQTPCDNQIRNQLDPVPPSELFPVFLFVQDPLRSVQLLNAVFSASTETLLSFCKEQRFLPAVTAVLHTFGSSLKRHVHVHVIISAGSLKLSGKAERYTRFEL